MLIKRKIDVKKPNKLQFKNVYKKTLIGTNLIFIKKNLDGIQIMHH